MLLRWQISEFSSLLLFLSNVNPNPFFHSKVRMLSIKVQFMLGNKKPESNYIGRLYTVKIVGPGKNKKKDKTRILSESSTTPTSILFLYHEVNHLSTGKQSLRTEFSGKSWLWLFLAASVKMISINSAFHHFSYFQMNEYVWLAEPKFQDTSAYKGNSEPCFTLQRSSQLGKFLKYREVFQKMIESLLYNDGYSSSYLTNPNTEEKL